MKKSVDFLAVSVILEGMIKNNYVAERRKVLLQGSEYTSKLKFVDPSRKKVIRRWLDQCEKVRELTKSFGQRDPNLTGGVSETVTAWRTGWGVQEGAIVGTSSKFDLFDTERNKRIELKATWKIGGSPVSFRSSGKSWELSDKWDELWFLDCSEWKTKGFQLYHVPNEVFDSFYGSPACETVEEQRLYAKERIMLNVLEQLKENKISPKDVFYV